MDEFFRAAYGEHADCTGVLDDASVKKLAGVRLLVWKVRTSTTSDCRMSAIRCIHNAECSQSRM